MSYHMVCVEVESLIGIIGCFFVVEVYCIDHIDVVEWCFVRGFVLDIGCIVDVGNFVVRFVV